MIWTQDAVALAEAFGRGRCDPVDMFEAVLAAATDWHEVFLDTFAARGRREAEAARGRWRAGAPLSPFDGVFVAWKDLFDVAGHRTTAGSATRCEIAPALRDAALVRRLTRAGMVNVGKTNLSELAYSGLGVNPHFGTPVLPRPGLAARVPGGSSAGAAIAVAAGIVPVAMGTDTAGSIRVPAAFNGLMGLRASRGRYDLSGMLPLAPTFDTAGPLTRSVRDLVLLDGLLRGELTPPRTPLPRTALRLVVDPAILTAPVVGEAVRGGIDACVTQLSRAGLMIESRRVPAWHDAWRCQDTLGWLAASEAYAEHEALLASPAAMHMDRRVRQRLMGARAQSGADVVRLYQARRVLRAALAEQLDGAFLLTPTVGHVAPPLAPLEADDDAFARCNLATLRLTMPGSFLDMPGVSLPAGQDAAGLPIGVLLSAPSGDDERLLRAALTLEACLRESV